MSDGGVANYEGFETFDDQKRSPSLINLLEGKKKMVAWKSDPVSLKSVLQNRRDIGLRIHFLRHGLGPMIMCGHDGSWVMIS